MECELGLLSADEESERSVQMLLWRDCVFACVRRRVSLSPIHSSPCARIVKIFSTSHWTNILTVVQGRRAEDAVSESPVVADRRQRLQCQ